MFINLSQPKGVIFQMDVITSNTGTCISSTCGNNLFLFSQKIISKVITSSVPTDSFLRIGYSVLFSLQTFGPWRWNGWSFERWRIFKVACYLHHSHDESYPPWVCSCVTHSIHEPTAFWACGERDWYFRVNYSQAWLNGVSRTGTEKVEEGIASTRMKEREGRRALKKEACRMVWLNYYFWTTVADDINIFCCANCILALPCGMYLELLKIQLKLN